MLEISTSVRGLAVDTSLPSTGVGSTAGVPFAN